MDRIQTLICTEPRLIIKLISVINITLLYAVCAGWSIFKGNDGYMKTIILLSISTVFNTWMKSVCNGVNIKDIVNIITKYIMDVFNFLDKICESAEFNLLCLMIILLTIIIHKK